jgi:hypothetical protein
LSYIARIKDANIAGVKDPPVGFIGWALRNGSSKTNQRFQLQLGQRGAT